MPPLKDEISPALARSLAAELRTAWPEFPTPRFTRRVGAALEPLELLARVDLLAERLAAVLPASFDDAATVLWRALGSPTFTGWMTLPCGTFVARQGLEAPDVSLLLLAGLTPRWSSEGPIRPFIRHHPEITYDYLRRWCSDDDEHVRRLVSEGTRPRLPWAPVLRSVIADPSPNIPLLDALVDDPSLYVRRSVANHLNDITKDHPGVALDLAEFWRARGDRARWVVRHGLRSLVKRGDARALSLLGVSTDTKVELVEFVLDRDRLAIGDACTFTFTVALPPGHETTECIIDYRIQYAGVRGVKAPKVFKLTRRSLEPGQPLTIRRRHAFEHASIRRIHPGPHQIDIQVNGIVLGSTSVDVVDPALETLPHVGP